MKINLSAKKPTIWVTATTPNIGFTGRKATISTTARKPGIAFKRII